MFSLHHLEGKSLQIGAYAVGAALISVLAGWCTLAVAVTLIGIVDSTVIDGSGHSAPLDPSAVAAVEQAVGIVPPANKPSDGPADKAASEPARRVFPVVAPRVSSDDPEVDPAFNFHNGSAGTYRTYCVRLCDGYYWPVSFSTTSARFESDAEICSNRCGSPARLFVHRMPGGGPGTMVSLEGLPYASLKTAFQFRTRYDAQCKCTPQPWEQQAKDQHRLFAAAESARKGNKAAASEARKLASDIAARNAIADSTKAQAEMQANRELAALSRKVALVPPSRAGRSDQSARSLALAEQLAGADNDFDFMRLGGQSPDPRRYRPASGTARAWRDRVFGDN
jgi:hypothetical protein